MAHCDREKGNNVLNNFEIITNELLARTQVSTPQLFALGKQESNETSDTHSHFVYQVF